MKILKEIDEYDLGMYFNILKTMKNLGLIEEPNEPGINGKGYTLYWQIYRELLSRTKDMDHIQDAIRYGIGNMVYRTVGK